MTLLFICEPQLCEHLTKQDFQDIMNNNLQVTALHLGQPTMQIPFYLHPFTPPWSAINDYDLKYFLYWPFTIHIVGIHATIEKI